MTEQASGTGQEARARREVLIVRAGGRLLGVFAEEAAGIERAGAAGVPLPHAPAAVLGIASVCGRMLTLLDPLVLLGEPRASVLTESTPGFILALRGDEQLALAVDGSERLCEIALDEIKAAGGAAAAIAHGTFQDGEAQEVILLDVTRLFAAAVKGMERRRRKRVPPDQH